MPRSAAVAALLAATLALSGCAVLLPWERTARGHADFWAEALAADAAAREHLWKQTLLGERDDDRVLRTALMQSLPGHLGSDMRSAERTLRALAERRSDVGVLARLRLAELGEGRECREETTELKRRLSKVVDIERTLDRNGD